MKTAQIISAGLSLTLIGAVGIGISTASAAAPSETFSTPGSHTWNVPAGITSIQITALGGGGAGSKVGHAPSSGGSGAKVTASSITVAPGDAVSIVVGGGGSTPAVGGGGGGGAATVVYKDTADASGLWIVAGGGGGGATGNVSTNGGIGAATNTAAGGSTQQVSTCNHATPGGSDGTGGVPSGSFPLTFGESGGDGLFGSGGNGGGRDSEAGGTGGALTLVGAATGGAGKSQGNAAGGGAGGGYGGGAGGCADVNVATGGGAGGSGAFNSAASGTVSYAPGANHGAVGASGGNGSVTIKWGSDPAPTPSAKPTKPSTLKVNGKPNSKSRVINWKAPKAGATPTGYRVTIKVRGSGKTVYRKNVGATVRKIKVSRSYLLKKTYRARGEVKSNVRYRAYVQTKSQNRISAARTVNFMVKG